MKVQVYAIVILVVTVVLGQGAPFVRSNIPHHRSPSPLKNDFIKRELFDSKVLQWLFQDVGIKDSTMNSQVVQGRRHMSWPGKEAAVVQQDNCPIKNGETFSLSGAIQIAIEAIIGYAEETSDPQPGDVLHVVGDLLEDLVERCGSRNEMVKTSVERLRNWYDTLVRIGQNRNLGHTAVDGKLGTSQRDTDAVTVK